ncbi:hypothetical protein SDC9_209636 [bioreactor metagenome]|uniref:Uncharacterized protein n=1 Tax=bioreactor metagenome TaxID=1076179 RepID=A0A645JFL8_9ZZZZ
MLTKLREKANVLQGHSIGAVMTEYELQVIDLLTQQLQQQAELQELTNILNTVTTGIQSIVYLLGFIGALILVLLFAKAWGSNTWS